MRNNHVTNSYKAGENDSFSPAFLNKDRLFRKSYSSLTRSQICGGIYCRRPRTVFFWGQGVTLIQLFVEVAEPDIYRDEIEIALIQAAQKAGKPVLDIYRGMQIINVTLGSNPYQGIYKSVP